MKNLFFLKRMYCKNDLRPLLYIYQPLSGKKTLKIAKIRKITYKRCSKDHTLVKCHPSIYAEPYRSILGQNCRNESCSARRFKYKSVLPDQNITN